MRSIEVLVPAGCHDEVMEILGERDIDYALTEETSGRDVSHLARFVLETEEVEPVLEELRAVGITEEGYVIVTEAQAVVSDRFEQRKEDREAAAEAADGDAEEDEKSSGQIAREELRTTAEELSRSSRNYVLFTVISAVVATAGLLTDSAAVVVGSMVIAPLIGPAMASSVGSVIKDDELFRDGVKAQFIGLGLAVASAAVFAAIARFTIAPTADVRVLTQVVERVNAGLLSLVIALGAGVAGALSLTSGVSAALVGVMIAAALIPPAATVGLGIAYGDTAMAASAGVLVLVNVMSINLTSLLTLWVKGYRPEKWYEEKTARRLTQKRVVLLVIGVVALSSFLVFTTVNTRDNIVFEERAEAIASEHLDEVHAVDVGYEPGLFQRHPRTVTVVTGEHDPDAAAAIAESIRVRTGKDVTLRVVQENVEVFGREPA